MATLEEQRAARVAAIAERHERRLAQTELDDRPVRAGSARAHHQHMAALNRRMQQRHLAAAQMHSCYADRLARWRENADPHAGRPLFLSAVASTLGAMGVAVTLLDSQEFEAVRAASNAIAGAAMDVEYTLREGPGHDAAIQRRPVTAASGDELLARWPRYGPAVAELGIHTVAAAPVRRGSHHFGALTAFDGPPDQPLDDLASTLLLAEQDIGFSLLTEADVQPVIHQAAGMIAARRGCDVLDALALIRAHAFATGDPTSHVAAAIVDRQLHLD